jgi:hypothetical protein
MKREVEIACPDCGEVVAVVVIEREVEPQLPTARKGEPARISWRHDCSVGLVGRERVPLKVRLG